MFAANTQLQSFARGPAPLYREFDQLPDAVDPPQVYVIGGKEFSTEQVVGMVFGFYCVLGFLGTRGGSKKEAPKAAESAPAAGGSVVSMLDDGFEAWAASPANMKKWEDSIAEMK